MQLGPNPANRRSNDATTPFLGLPPALRLYLGSILFLSALTVLAFIHYRLAGYHTSDLWIHTRDRYRDLNQYDRLFKFLHTSAFFHDKLDRFAYPAPCAVLFALLFKAFPHVHAVYVVLFLPTLVCSAFLLFRALVHFGLQRSGAAALASIIMVTSYPWMILYDRANIELFLYLFLAAGFWAYLTGRKTLAAALWGCAGSMKIYPIILLAVFLHRSTIRPLIVGLFTATAALLLSFWFVGPTISEAAVGTLNGVRGFVGHYANGFNSTGVDHSIMGAAKELFAAHSALSAHQWATIGTLYQLIIALGGLILWFSRIRKLPEPNQFCLLLVAIVLFPPVSYDYTLIHTYLALGFVLAAYLSSLRSARPFPAAKTLFIAFALVATSQTWMQNHSFRLNGVIKCAALVTIFIVLLRHPLTIDSADPDARSLAA
jgi:hypothetical protein